MRHATLLTISLAVLGCSGPVEPLLTDEEQAALTEAIVEETRELRSRDEAIAASSMLEQDFEVRAAEEPDSEEQASKDEPDEASLPEPVHVASFSLRRGETLTHFARWSELPVEDIADESGLELDELHPVGTTVLIAISPQDQSMVEERRERHRLQRVQSYVASRGGAAGIGFHRVRTGETAWSIARDAQGIPVWLLEAYNPSIDIERLRPGQELRVPRIDDTVAEVEEESSEE